MLFEGIFAAGESRENCGEDVVEESSFDVDLEADVFEHEDHFDLESDAYLSTARDDSSGLGASKDASPMSVPCSGKASGSSQSSGKRERSPGELAEITTMLQTHLVSSQSDKDMLRNIWEREEEPAKIVFEQAHIEFERKKEEVKKAKAYSLEQC